MAPRDQQTATFAWHRDRVARQVDAAVRGALEETAGRCVALAQERVRVDTGALRADIAARPPRRHRNGWSVAFGAFAIPYAFLQEVLPEPRGRAYLRPAADREAPELRGRIAARLGPYAGIVRRGRR